MVDSKIGNVSTFMDQAVNRKDVAISSFKVLLFKALVVTNTPPFGLENNVEVHVDNVFH